MEKPSRISKGRSESGLCPLCVGKDPNGPAPEFASRRQDFPLALFPFVQSILVKALNFLGNGFPTVFSGGESRRIAHPASAIIIHQESECRGDLFRTRGVGDDITRLLPLSTRSFAPTFLLMTTGKEAAMASKIVIPKVSNFESMEKSVAGEVKTRQFFLRHRAEEENLFSNFQLPGEFRKFLDISLCR